MKVRCIKLPENPRSQLGAKSIIEVGVIYEVVDAGVYTFGGSPAYEIAEHIGYCYAQHLFKPIDNEYADITSELAQQVVVGDTADQVVKVRVVSN